MSSNQPDDPGGGSDGDEDPHRGVVEEFRPDTPGSALHVYADPQRAAERARELPGDTRVVTTKRNGKQRREIQEKVEEESLNGANVEVWLTAEIED